MKKGLIVLALLVVLGGVGAAFVFLRTPERRICTQLGNLCGAQGTYQDYGACVDQIEQLGKALGEERVEQAATCVADMDTCPAAVGCIAGTGVQMMQDAMGEFLKGVNRSKEKK